MRIRNFYFDYFPFAVHKNSHFTISIGGIQAGGPGKTPLTLLVAHWFRIHGYTIAFLSRGYKRKINRPLIIKPNQSCSWEEIGDEPALIQHHFPDAWFGIGKNRSRSSKILAPLIPKRSVFICDDAFQHRKMGRDVDILCISADTLYGHLLPAGYLREPPDAIQRANIICIIGSSQETGRLIDLQKQLLKHYKMENIFILNQNPDGWINLKTKKHADQINFPNPLLISGIAHPIRFRKMVESLGIKVSAIKEYEDHHQYLPEEIESWNRIEAGSILTTEKDALKLFSFNSVICKDIWYLKIKLSFIDIYEEKKFFNCFKTSQISF